MTVVHLLVNYCKHISTFTRTFPTSLKGRSHYIRYSHMSVTSKASGKTSCPSYALEAIYGVQENKAQKYNQSLENWWKEYAARKNDEEEEHVADSLMYDERTSLPRMVPRPDVIDDHTARDHIQKVEQQIQEQRQQQQQQQQQQQPAAIKDAKS